MRKARWEAGAVTKNIQIRHVPDELHRTLKARAAMASMSLSDYLMNYMQRLADRPTPEEMRAPRWARAGARLRAGGTAAAARTRP